MSHTQGLALVLTGIGWLMLCWYLICRRRMDAAWRRAIERLDPDETDIDTFIEGVFKTLGEK